MPRTSDGSRNSFHADIDAAVQGTPFDLDMLTALACQETGEIWPLLRKDPQLSVPQIVALCVGDTLDSDRGRRAFPKTKAELVQAANGPAMFDIARKALSIWRRTSKLPTRRLQSQQVCPRLWSLAIRPAVLPRRSAILPPEKIRAADQTLGKPWKLPRRAEEGRLKKNIAYRLRDGLRGDRYNTGGFNPHAA